MDGPTPSDLIPELAEWLEEGVDPLLPLRLQDWSAHVGSASLAISYSAIFWPQFELVDGFIVRAHPMAGELIEQWRSNGRHERRTIEAAINHLHLSDLHTDTSPEPTETQLRFLGRTLREIHQVKLAAEFPDRCFVVAFNDEPGLDALAYELTFWQAD